VDTVRRTTEVTRRITEKTRFGLRETREVQPGSSHDGRRWLWFIGSFGESSLALFPISQLWKTGKKEGEERERRQQETAGERRKTGGGRRKEGGRRRKEKMLRKGEVSSNKVVLREGFVKDPLAVDSGAEFCAEEEGA